jgi:hypothetical protein
MSTNIEKAIYDVKVLNKTYREAASDNNITYNKLYRHANKSDVLNSGGQFLLNNSEQKKLVEYIDICLKRGCPRSSQDVLDAAHTILKLRKGKNASKPGRSWLRNFLKFHNLTIRKSQKLPKSSAVVSKDDIFGWFNSTKDSLVAEGVFDILSNPARLLNADETFLLLNPSIGNVVAPIGTKYVCDIQGEFQTF